MKSKEEKINSIRKIFKCILVVLVIAIILLVISLKFLVPNDSTKEGFYVTINGEVKASNPSTISLPDYVRVYYPFYYMRNLGEQGKQIDIASIDWTGNPGVFTLSFWIPIQMEVIVTADPEGCNHLPIGISAEDNIKNVELKFDGSNCKENYTLPNTQEELVKKAKEGFDRLFTESSSEFLSKDETKSMNEDRKKGGREIEKIHSETASNASLLHAYNAYWLLWRGYYKSDLAELRDCVEEAIPYIIPNQTCIILPYLEKQEILGSNRTYASGNTSWILRERPEEIKSIEEAKQTYYSIRNERSRIRAAYNDCRSALPVIKKSFSEQESICKIRETSVKWLKWFEALAFVCLGFIIFYPLRRWIEK